MPRANNPAPASASSVSVSTNANANAPVQTFRHRNIKAAIWKNETQNGVMFNVTITRSYRDEGGEWHDSQSFGYDDLTHVAKLMYDAHSYISVERAKLAAAGRNAPPRAQRSSSSPTS